MKIKVFTPGKVLDTFLKVLETKDTDLAHLVARKFVKDILEDDNLELTLQQYLDDLDNSGELQEVIELAQEKKRRKDR